MLLSLATMAQEGELTNGKVWYSVYLKKKIATHWEFSNYLVFSFSQGTKFAFFQDDISFRYRFNRLISLQATYKHAQYSVYPGITKVYPQPITVFETIIFHGAALDLRYDQPIGKRFKFTQSLIAQGFFPSFQKYQFRYISSTKFSYRSSKRLLYLTPYAKFMLYYYHNGKPLNYYNEDGTIDHYGSSNGFHRYRATFGFSFKPIRKIKQLGLNFYYAINREFNFSNSGSKLNVEVPAGGHRYQTALPFNNYDIIGIQLNILL